MNTQVVITFDPDTTPETKISAIKSFIHNCEDKPYLLEIGTALSGPLFDSSDNMGFHRVGLWSINTINEK